MEEMEKKSGKGGKMALVGGAVLSVVLISGIAIGQGRNHGSLSNRTDEQLQRDLDKGLSLSRSLYSI